LVKRLLPLGFSLPKELIIGLGRLEGLISIIHFRFKGRLGKIGGIGGPYGLLQGVENEFDESYKIYDEIYDGIDVEKGKIRPKKRLSI